MSGSPHFGAPIGRHGFVSEPGRRVRILDDVRLNELAVFVLEMIERPPPDEHRIKYKADSVQVGAHVDRNAHGDLGAQVPRRAEDRAFFGSELLRKRDDELVSRHDASKPEVENLHEISHAAARAEHDVRRLHVSVHETGVVSLAGPPLGGALVEWVSWRWIFFLNLPMAAFAVLMTWRSLPPAPPRPPPPTRSPRAPPPSQQNPKK